MDKTFKDISTSPKNKTPLIYSHFDYTKRVKLREKLEYIFNELGIDNVIGIRDFILAEMVDIMTFILKKNKTKICASIEQYIPKSTLTAKIRESLLPTVIPQGTNYDEFEKGADSERIKILSLIDTLEVKDVDEIIKNAEDHAYFAGSENTREKLIDKACKWWEDELSYPSMTPEEIKWYKSKVRKFRKAMEDET